MSDMDEFTKLTSGGSDDSARRADIGAMKRRLRQNGDLDGISYPEEERKIKPGQLCQYTQVGTNFMPATSTIKTLPSDCYTLQMTDRGEIVYLPQNLSTDELMRLPDSKSDEVIEEVAKFWTLKSKFKDLGFSHKRGFLLWGPPGSGKTSTISIILKEMVKLNGTVFLAQAPHVLAKALADFRTIEPDRPLVVIWEDIDAIIEIFGESVVLSVLDGESQVENVVFIATTNYPEKLDGRIVNRPSRFDQIVKIGMPNDEARKMYLEFKIGTTTAPDGSDLVAETKDLSIAHLRELIVSIYCQGSDTKKTLERLKKMKQVPNSAREGNGLGLGMS